MKKKLLAFGIPVLVTGSAVGIFTLNAPDNEKNISENKESTTVKAGQINKPTKVDTTQAQNKTIPKQTKAQDAPINTTPAPDPGIPPSVASVIGMRRGDSLAVIVTISQGTYPLGATTVTVNNETKPITASNMVPSTVNFSIPGGDTTTATVTITDSFGTKITANHTINY